MLIEIRGKRAMFCRPECAVERVSYEIPTAEALRGALDSVFWHPGMYWDIKSCTVMNEIKHDWILLNEVSFKGNVGNFVRAAKKNEILSLSPNAKEGRTQRNNRVLVDVRYIVDAVIKEREGELPAEESIDKYNGIAIRRLQDGSYYKSPVLGCYPYTCECLLLDHMPEEKSFYFGRQIDFGMMRCRNGKVKHHVMIDGVINYHHPDVVKKNEPLERQYGLVEALYSAYPDIYAKGLLPEESMEMTRIMFRLDLDEGCKLSYMDPEKKKSVVIQTPIKLANSNSIVSNFGWGNASYLYGMSKKNAANQKRSEECKEAFLYFHKSFLLGTQSSAATAILKFLGSDLPEVDEKVAKDLEAGSMIALYFNGHPVWEETELFDLWNQKYEQIKSEAVKGICSITGKETFIDETHPRIDGFSGSDKGILVCVNIESAQYEGRKQGYVASIGKEAAKRYADVLNYLGSDFSLRMSIKNLKTVFVGFPVDGGDIRYTKAIAAVLKGQEPEWELPGEQVIHIFSLFPSKTRLFIGLDKEMKYAEFLERMKRFGETYQVGNSKATVYGIFHMLLGDYRADETLPVAILDEILNGRPLPYIVKMYLKSALTYRMDEKHLLMMHEIVNKEEEMTKKEELLVQLGKLFRQCEDVQKRTLVKKENEGQRNSTTKKYTIYDSFFQQFCTSPSSMLMVIVNEGKKSAKKLKGYKKWDRKVNECLTEVFAVGEPIPDHLAPREHVYILQGYNMSPGPIILDEEDDDDCDYEE